MCFSTMKFSASLDKAGVSKIGHKCLMMLETSFSVGIGLCQLVSMLGVASVLHEALSRCVIGSART